MIDGLTFPADYFSPMDSTRRGQGHEEYLHVHYYAEPGLTRRISENPGGRRLCSILGSARGERSAENHCPRPLSEKNPWEYPQTRPLGGPRQDAPRPSKWKRTHPKRNTPLKPPLPRGLNLSRAMIYNYHGMRGRWKPWPTGKALQDDGGGDVVIILSKASASSGDGRRGFLEPRWKSDAFLSSYSVFFIPCCF